MVTTAWCAPVTPLAIACSPTFDTDPGAPDCDGLPSAFDCSGDEFWGAAAFDTSLSLLGMVVDPAIGAPGDATSGDDAPLALLDLL